MHRMAPEQSSGGGGGGGGDEGTYMVGVQRGQLPWRQYMNIATPAVTQVEAILNTRPSNSPVSYSNQTPSFLSPAGHCIHFMTCSRWWKKDQAGLSVQRSYSPSATTAGWSCSSLTVSVRPAHTHTQPAHAAAVATGYRSGGMQSIHAV